MAGLNLVADLAVKSPLDSHRPGDGLAVYHLWFAHLGRHPKLFHEPPGDNIQVQLAHAPEYGLRRLLVKLDVEGGVFAGESLQCQGEFLLVPHGAGFDGDRNDRFGKFNCFELDGLRLEA